MFVGRLSGIVSHLITLSARWSDMKTLSGRVQFPVDVDCRVGIFLGSVCVRVRAFVASISFSDSARLLVVNR